MTPSEQIDHLIETHDDWRGSTLAECRRIVLAADAGIVEEWKYMGAPVWSLDGILIVGNIFTTRVKLGFLYGASLDDPDGLFNGELGGNQRRSVEFAEGDPVREAPLTELVRAAVRRNRAKPATRRPAARPKAT